MTRNMRQRMVRALVSAIVGSDLSPTELRAMAANLRHDEAFMDDLSFMLSNAVSMIEGLPSKAIDPNLRRDLRGQVKDPVERAMDVVNRRRWSKREIADLFVEAEPKYERSHLDHAKTMRELVRDFMQTSSPEGSIRFLTRLGIQPSQDPYLEGIGQKR